ncbi:MAG: phage antirepressor KilAC domain-containing protein [Kiritimatiellae bacterium]|nr:phage antirepressor KilAC domain-containing protein [Kiritimatiellia bacterium]
MEVDVGELIKVSYDSGTPLVSARELHKFLEVETPYHKWFPRMCEYGFAESTDFTVTDIFVHNSAGGPQTKKDAALTIDMAKEICMLQRSEKGKQARQYFIQLEKDWNSAEKVMARALVMAQRTIEARSARICELEEQAKLDKPKVIFADSVSAANTSILVGEMAKILKQNGVENMGQNRLFAWMRDNGYLIKRQGMDYNMPTQYAMERGLFEIKETSVVHSDGHTSVNKTPKVTGRGQVYFANKFLGEGEAE